MEMSQTVLSIGSNGLTVTDMYSGVNFDHKTYEDVDYIYDEILKRLSEKPLIEHKCHNCGATLTMEENKHIFICKYCGSVYAIGTNMINDKGE